MSKVTSKLQVTVPKTIANAFGIRPGDEIEWVAADNVIRVFPARLAAKRPAAVDRLRLFDAATARQKERPRRRAKRSVAARGWTREELYRRGRAD